MKNKELCKKCKYRGTIGSRDSSIDSIVCDYAATSKNGTCLKNHKGKAVDRRGRDPEKCLLFEEGEALGRAMNSDPFLEEKKIHRRLGDGK